ncbi:sensor histidine kinase [Dyella telluris]|uniref:histidine kinase n=1 Tax=Dyella telluris TaxID=2763498 RepID=A0A7G8PZ60_9GAMM|nr:HAMP domain-containing sensor histidine kinase [Dyella telluris]QNJ99817.1 HAMP domain-containing histidine kinase [Dyella telluris]
MDIKASRVIKDWLSRVPPNDPVDALNSPFVQAFLILFSLMLFPSWLYSVVVQSPATLQERVALGLDTLILLSAWMAVVAIRRGRFRAGVKLFLAVIVVSTVVAYAVTGYKHGSRDALPTLLLATSGLVLGRRALWMAYAAVVVALCVGQLADSFWLPPSKPEELAVFHALPVRIGAYFVIAIIFDRFIIRFRATLGQVAQSAAELAAVNERLQQQIREREEMLRQLIHSQRVEAVGRVTTGLAHDFDNILNVVLGYSSEREMLADLGTPSLLSALEGIELAALRGLAINRKLLNFSRKDTGPAQIVDVVTVVRELEPMLRQLLGRHIRVDIHCCNERLPVLFDRSQLELVVLNIASNARDAMPDGGQFTVSVEPCMDGTARILLADTGIGMDADVQAKLFEPFYTTKPLGVGTGLGLSVVASVIEAAKGKISVASTPRVGTRFRIDLPLHETSGAGSENQGPHGQPDPAAGVSL